MSPKYKLVYFNLRARGEVLRLLFHAAGVQFVDQRVEFVDWPALKSKTPDGTLPYLCIDDKEFGETMPIARYIARKYNLMGKTDLDQLSMDIIINSIEEIRNAIGRVRNETILTDAQKKELETKIKTEQFPKLLMKMEKRLTDSKHGFLVGDSVSIADIAFSDVLETPLKTAPNMLDQFPKVAEHYKKIRSLPRIAKYLATRPECDF